MREIVFDTETTGIDHGNGDRMVEIGCIEMIDRVMTGRTFHCYFNPERAMDPGAERIHGLGDAFLRDKPRFTDKALELIEFIGEDMLVAHNAMFDFGFLNMEFGRCGHPVVDYVRMIDTVAMARKKHPGAKASLDALCTRYGIDRSHRVKHGALLDAELLAQLYIELTGGRQIGLSLGADASSPGREARVTPSQLPTGATRAPRHHAPTDEELARHRAFIAGIEGSLWSSGRARL
ncbi:DNA polymerase III subunit epsilon [Novosphingopyxis sp.]|uniref:DNA polymerase III subunit epsilon n=1 Tax=Novosphingopyxis sp. TaxID=2709690 RepID=UPI003B58E808